jgi:hypothetical protein
VIVLVPTKAPFSADRQLAERRHFDHATTTARRTIAPPNLSRASGLL